MYDYTQDNLSVTNACWTCQQADRICDACADERDARDTANAWEIVEDGNQVYRWKTHKIADEPSGHDWVSSHTRIRVTLEHEKPQIREESLEPMTWLIDRIFEIDVEVPVGYTICTNCHYMCNSHVSCPNCELVNN
jgi:hypothetical protein